MLIVTDDKGKVVGAADIEEFEENRQQGAQEQIQVSVRPLAGQEVHVVEVPHEIASLPSGADLQLAFSEAVIETGPTRIHFKQFRGTEQG
ncbi:hypothetical protein SLV14_001674 [Streptomyces sp. Je 1-4]|uniref:hypothetical protein n=1 Tax=Streptomyces TaxID=1883 RepID=UPI0021DA5737|nr:MULTISPECIES: hypothetical protein [unclassified Streptomyces]UYB39208.1 hypothetical protein SLV14_001674 [Streptomyces sp. Je 1-4]UZQ35223.1 hypothetical protein SLV14N_001674 [Streptomyces sp. Je 1-4] [Streptomyces sp. Je 1-4 4N24]UZQ42641.1 hypothetical protein SLV14NA_001674 [Streptomyces sp. Je 1-4] [Streptomyces sp. Je 1-4 4N24_ara]